MSRYIRGSMKLSVLAALALALGLALAGAPAASAKSCSPPKYPGNGYFTSLTVKNTTCAKGRKVALAHYRCRTENGKAGRCKRRVLRFSCSETRTKIPTELNGRVTCKRGGKRVVYTYQQNL